MEKEFNGPVSTKEWLLANNVFDNLYRLGASSAQIDEIANRFKLFYKLVNGWAAPFMEPKSVTVGVEYDAEPILELLPKLNENENCFHVFCRLIKRRPITVVHATKEGFVFDSEKIQCNTNLEDLFAELENTGYITNCSVTGPFSFAFTMDLIKFYEVNGLWFDFRELFELAHAGIYLLQRPKITLTPIV